MCYAYSLSVTWEINLWLGITESIHNARASLSQRQCLHQSTCSEVEEGETYLCTYTTQITPTLTDFGPGHRIPHTWGYHDKTWYFVQLKHYIWIQVLKKKKTSGIPDHSAWKLVRVGVADFLKQYLNRKKNPTLGQFLNCRGSFNRHIVNPNYVLWHLALLRCIIT